jgi:hypothetical protein
VLYDKHVSGFLYRTSASATEIAVPRPRADPLHAMQKVADAIPHRPIVLTLVSPPPLQQVAFVSPAGAKRIVSGNRAAKRFAASAARGPKALAISAERGTRFPRRSQANITIAQVESRARREAPPAEDLNAVDRVRNFLDRHLWLHIEELKLRGED